MKHYHFIGIGGIGMSGIAKVLLQKGNKVSGSDLVLNKQTDELTKLGAEVFQGHSSENIDPDVDFVIVSSAIKENNPEIIKAKELGKKILSRSELLNEVITVDQSAIAVTGTHGKTTTSSMIATILEKAGLEPTSIIGSEVKALEGNAKFGNGKYSIAEVCEYQRAFLDIYPHSAVITNIEEDHLDCFKDIDDIISAFAEFTTHIDKDGFLVTFGEDKNINKAIEGYTGRLIKYGQSHQNDWYIENLEADKNKITFNVMRDGEKLENFELKIPGIHNALNALAAIIVARTLEVETSVIKEALSEFTGAQRRFEIKGEKDGVLFIDDYGHHPTEILATLAGAREFYKDRRIVAVFQPHQYSRTRFLLEDFSKSFDDADLVLIPEIYAVRDTAEDIASVSSEDLTDKINKISKNKAIFFKDFDSTIEYLEEHIKTGDVVITIGAGPVVEIGERVLDRASGSHKLDKQQY